MAASGTPHRIAVIGGGKRGIHLATLLLNNPSRATLAAMAEPLEIRREECRSRLGLPANGCYSDHRELLDRCPDLDAVILATSVRTHCELACYCMEKGLAIYLEKPIAGTIEGAQRIVRAAERTGVPVQVGFNLRYAPFFEKLREIAVSGKLGQVLSVNWTEEIPVGMWADDYCRSAFYKSRAAIGSLLLEKSCHDIDQINWVLGVPCERVASFGSRRFFVPRLDVPERCTPECPQHETCLYYAPGQEARGRLMPEESDVCVYHSGSDLVDRLTTIFEFEDGAVANLNVQAVWAPPGRFVRICGTKASLVAVGAENRISVCDLQTNVETVYHPTVTEEGHGGGDARIVAAFLDLLDNPSLRPRATLLDGLESVLMACASDLARRERRVVELAPLRASGSGDLEEGKK